MTLEVSVPDPELEKIKERVLGMNELLLGNKNSKNFIPLFPRERIYQKRSSTDQLSTFISQMNQNKK